MTGPNLNYSAERRKADGGHSNDTLSRTEAARVAALVRKLMAAKGLVSDRVAEQAGLRPSTLYRLLTQQHLTNSTLKKLQAWAARLSQGK